MSDVVLWEALERVGLYERVIQLGGLDSFLDRRRVSFGEKARFSLCRALLLKRPFLLLEEPFAPLDSMTLVSFVQVLNLEKCYSGILVSSRFIPDGLSVSSELRHREPEEKQSLHVDII